MMGEPSGDVIPVDEDIEEPKEDAIEEPIPVDPAIGRIPLELIIRGRILEGGLAPPTLPPKELVELVIVGLIPPTADLNPDWFKNVGGLPPALPTD